MCGIVGYVGSKSAAPIIVDGLRKLEYRGYDSAGIAIHDGKSIEIVRTLGKLAKLSEALEKRTLLGSTGIGHTRWATHGRPSEVNAHPHSAGPVAVVHNGIIENHVAIRQELEGQGVKFLSDTDTEIVAHLIHRELDPGRAQPLRGHARRAPPRRRRLRHRGALPHRARRDRGRAQRLAAGRRRGRGRDALRQRHPRPARPHAQDDLPGGRRHRRAQGQRIPHRDRRRGEGRAARQADRLEPRAGREERLQALHAQGDPRAARRGRGHAARPHRSRRRRRLRHRDRRHPRVRPQLRRVYFVACGTSHHAAMAGRLLDREDRPRPRRRRAGERGALPRSHLLPRRSGGGHQPVRRDHRHALRGQGRQGGGRQGPRHLQRRRQRHPAPRRRRPLHPRRARDRRRLHQVLHGAARRAPPARRLPRPPPRRARPGQGAGGAPGAVGDAEPHARGARRRRLRARHRQEAHPRHATCSSSAAAWASPSRSRAPSS